MEPNQKPEAIHAPLGAMPGPPEDLAECNRIGEEVWIGLGLRYQNIASKQDLDLLHNLPENPDKHAHYQSALKRFDEFILSQFAEWGWRMLLSTEIVRTLARWEGRHPELLERLGAALALKSRVYRGEKSAQLANDIDSFADAVIMELQTLLRSQRDEFRRRPVSSRRCEQIAEWMKVKIEEGRDEFPKLHAHLPQLCGYVGNYLPAHSKKTASLLEKGKIGARSFFYRWYAASTNRNVKDVRNLISLHRRQNRTS